MADLPAADPADIEAGRRLLAAATSVAVLTGAGVSTDSGIPDFRGPEGVWTKNPEAEKQSHISMYVSDPEHRKHKWARLAEGSMWEGKAPNAGHKALVDLEAQGKLHTLVTQNVDGLHELAGTSLDKLIEVHGTTKRVKCLDCGEEAPMEKALARVRDGDEDPACRSCDGILKAATVSFGQSLVPDDLTRADEAAHACDLMLCVGSTLAVYPVAHMVPTAVRNGADLMIINGEPTQFDSVATLVINASISDVLPQIVGAAPAK